MKSLVCSSRFRKALVTGGFSILAVSTALATDINWAEKATVSASSQREDFGPGNLNDQIISDTSRWLAAEDDPKPWVELAFLDPHPLVRRCRNRIVAKVDSIGLVVRR